MSAGLLSYYYQLIREKEEEIKRLGEAEGKLAVYQGELAGYRDYYYEPELSGNTWSGQQADGFETHRTALQDSYQELKDDQYESVFTAIAAKIKELREQIQLYRSIIGSIIANMEKQEM
ncbi:YwqH-like family protein [Peribacillus sp. SCS-37]|uniref:YwqH-like family protein n=1 Tax=Paraperibacillus esterisolvens TaxID=3115296 RepID=UPI003905B4E8